MPLHRNTKLNKAKHADLWQDCLRGLGGSDLQEAENVDNSSYI